MSKLTESARGRECQIRIPGICNRDESTTVLAHLNGGGMGMKHSDIHGAFACSSCHDAYDRRIRLDLDKNYVDFLFYQAMVRTQIIWLKMGLIKI